MPGTELSSTRFCDHRSAEETEMSNLKRSLTRTIGALAILASIVIGVAALNTETQAARPGGPLCGPTILWQCTWDDGSVHMVGLTVCDLAAYEQAHHATCVPSPW